MVWCWLGDGQLFPGGSPHNSSAFQNVPPTYTVPFDTLSGERVQSDHRRFAVKMIARTHLGTAMTPLHLSGIRVAMEMKVVTITLGFGTIG